MEEEEKKSKPKVGVNVVMVDWDQPILDVFVTTRGQKVHMPKEQIHERKLSPMRQWRTKWERKNNVLQDVVKELQSI